MNARDIISSEYLKNIFFVKYKMIELFTLRKAMDQNNSDGNPYDDDKSMELTEWQKKIFAFFLFIYFIILCWALHIAIFVNGKGDRTALAVHLMFAFSSPMLYVLCYLLVPGFGSIAAV